MANIYTQVDFKTGAIQEYSKEAKEGYEARKNSKGETSYYKTFEKGITGKLLSVGTRKGNFGRELSIAMKVGNDVVYIKFGMYSQKGQLDNTYLESIIRHLPALKKGDEYTIYAYNFLPEGGKYKQIGVSFKQGGEKVNPVLTYERIDKDGNVTAGDIPAIVWKEMPGGDRKPDAVFVQKKEEYLLTIIEKYAGDGGSLAYSKDSGSDNSSPKTEEAPKTADPSLPKGVEEAVIVDTDDDLPF